MPAPAQLHLRLQFLGPAWRNLCAAASQGCTHLDHSGASSPQQQPQQQPQLLGISQTRFGRPHTPPPAPWAALQHARHASSWAFWRSSKPAATSEQSATLASKWDSDSSSHHSSSSTDSAPIIATDDSFLPSTLESADTIERVCDALEQASITSAKTDAFFTTSMFIDAFEQAHAAGLPWWAALAAVNMTTRLLMSPAIILQQRATAKMLAFNLSMTHAKELQQELSRAKTVEEQQRLSFALREEYDKQIAKHGHPLKIVYVVPLVMIANATIFISIFSATSLLMDSKAPSLTTGGALWFLDLTVPDAYYGLPVLCCLVTLAMVEYGITLGGEQPPAMQQQAATFKWLMRFFSLLFIPTGAYVPAGVATLWVSNSLFGVAQGFMLRSDSFRQGVGLPTMAEMRDLSNRLAAVSRPQNPWPGAAATPPPPPPGSPPRVM